MQALLQLVWGDGFLSAGGEEEVARLLEGTDISGCHVLDIGCGLGAIDELLVSRHGAGSVIGIDVDPALLLQMDARIRRRPRRPDPQSTRGTRTAAVCRLQLRRRIFEGLAGADPAENGIVCGGQAGAAPGRALYCERLAACRGRRVFSRDARVLPARGHCLQHGVACAK